MTELEIIKRKIILKKQAVHIHQDEIKGLKFQEALLREKARLEGKMGKPFDPALSLKLDAIIECWRQ